MVGGNNAGDVRIGVGRRGRAGIVHRCGRERILHVGVDAARRLLRHPHNVTGRGIEHEQRPAFGVDRAVAAAQENHPAIIGCARGVGPNLQGADGRRRREHVEPGLAHDG